MNVHWSAEKSYLIEATRDINIDNHFLDSAKILNHDQNYSLSFAPTSRAFNLKSAVASYLDYEEIIPKEKYKIHGFKSLINYVIKTKNEK
ncbi:unnamed protein product [marine sediment metagenome]|uniref:Uncharacterized protein n=1 Tax=marine sediment metagenome TaxID=412755 RepID=X0W3E5_9ZZZZ